VSKRPEDDPQSDLEVGMTTAERRRRRRRGAGLRVPSDNVPRRTSPPVAAPVPEDPSLAMSIAYSFTSDASQPVPLQADPAAQTYPDPAAPTPLTTVIDPPSAPVEQADFEMNTREMSAVDLEALGLSELQARTTTIPNLGGDVGVGDDGDGVPRVAPGADTGDAEAGYPRARATRAKTRPDSGGDVDVDVADVEEATAIAAPPEPAAAPMPEPAPAPTYKRERLRTVALTDEDLEEVREAVRAMEQASQPSAAAAAPQPVGQGVVASPMPLTQPGAQALTAAPLGGTSGQIPLPTAAAAQTPLGQAQTPLGQAQAPLGETPGQIPLSAGQAQTTPPRPPPTPPHGMSTVPHTTMPPPLASARDTRSAADDMWGEDTPVPRPVPQEAPRVEAMPRAKTLPPGAGLPASPPPPPPRRNSIPPLSVAIDQSNRTQPLTPLDLESPDAVRAEGASGVPVVAIPSEPSGEFEVDVDADDDAEEISAAATAAAAAEAQRARTPSTPPPPAGSAGATAPAPAPAPAQPAAATPVPAGTPSGQHAIPTPATGTPTVKDPHHAHPPPPPPAALHHQPKPPTPPAPPQPVKKEPAAKPASPAPSRTTTDTRQRAKPWFVEVFDEDYLRTLPFLTPQATQAEAEFVADAMQLTPGAQVLDVGCGYGRHAMELAARGFHVVGLDLSTPLLLRGGEEAQRRGLQINFVRGDMRELDFDSQFDGAYCLFSTFGYFDDETNKRTILNIARALKPGGRILLEILNRDYVIADLPTRVWWEGDGCVVLEEIELNYFSSRIQVNRSVVFDDGRQVEQEISIRAYSLHEVGKIMHAAGFRVLEVSGGYQTRGRFFGNQSRHIIVLAERKDPAAT
jgi:SAM-dependent methyltransferase